MKKKLFKEKKLNLVWKLTRGVRFCSDRVLLPRFRAPVRKAAMRAGQGQRPDCLCQTLLQLLPVTHGHSYQRPQVLPTNTFINQFIHYLYACLPSAYCMQGGEPTVDTKGTRCSNKRGQRKPPWNQGNIYFNRINKKEETEEKIYYCPMAYTCLLFKKNKNTNKFCNTCLAFRGAAESHSLFVGDHRQWKGSNLGVS